MNTSQTHFTIQEASNLTALTTHTLRYYERIGLLMPIGRASNGHRRYSQQEISLIRGLYCWLQTGMPIAEIQRCVRLYQAGDSTAAERRALLETHRQKVVHQIEELQATLQLMDYKIQHYTEIEENLT